MTHPLSGFDSQGNPIPWGKSAYIEDKIWLMERGHIPKDKKLMEYYYASKEMARRDFIKEYRSIISDMNL